MDRDAPPVFLTGFMGSGKSTVGRALAARGGGAFADTDDLVVATEGRSIERIFRESGEGAFRAAEERALIGLGEARGKVVATGGGLFLGASQRARMKRLGTVLWLDVPLEVAVDRVGDGDGRPLWLPDEPIEFRRWYDRRRTTYALAHARVSAEASPDEVVERCLEALARLAHPIGIARDPRKS